jgi:PAS domain S-box-containing protein
LRRANAYNRSLIEASLDPLVTISPDGKITDVNETTVKVTGVARGKLIGSNFSNYFTEPEQARAGYREVFERGSVTDYPLTIRHESGELTDVLFNASVYRGSDGNVLGVFAAARDITERKRAEIEIRKLNDELEQRVAQRTTELEASNKELEAFTYSVSHDLRAPLRHVEGFSKLLQEEHGNELSADAQDYVSTIRESVLQMGVLIDDLLNLARVGRKELKVQVAGLNSLVEEVVGDLQQANPHRQLDWRIQTLPFVECDPALLKQVFVNLLSNAVKFTRPRNPAVIEVGTCRQDDHTAIYVRDNGVGFSMKYADKLFGVFQRLHRSEDFEGTGVGLATVQRIIRKHGGQVWAEGKLDQGATFHFTLGSLNEQPDGPFPSGGNI